MSSEVARPHRGIAVPSPMWLWLPVGVRGQQLANGHQVIVLLVVKPNSLVQKSQPEGTQPHRQEDGLLTVRYGKVPFSLPLFE